MAVRYLVDVKDNYSDRWCSHRNVGSLAEADNIVECSPKRWHMRIVKRETITVETVISERTSVNEAETVAQ